MAHGCHYRTTFVLVLCVVLVFVYIYFDDSNEGKKQEETVALGGPDLRYNLQTKLDSIMV
jgi:hypothetical protein